MEGGTRPCVWGGAGKKMGTVAAQFPYRTNAQKGGMIMGWAKKRKREQQSKEERSDGGQY